MAAQKTARASPELRKGSTQPALPSDLHHNPGHKLLLFLASRIRGDRAWHDAMTGDLDRKGRTALKQWKQWTLNAAQIKARKMRGEDRGYVSVWMDLTIDGDAETGTDDFTVMREADGWRISGLPS